MKVYNEYDTMMNEIKDVISKWGWYINDKKLLYTDYISVPSYQKPKVEQDFEIKLRRNVRLGE